MNTEMNNRQALNDIAASQKMQHIKDYCELGAALSSIANIMMRKGVSAVEAMEPEYDNERIALMLSEGVDVQDAEELVQRDIETLLHGD